MKKKNDQIDVWIIEDNPGDAFLLEELLLIAGFSSRRIKVFNRMFSALECQQEIGPDIILLDLFLPDTSGIQTFLTVQKEFPYAPILVMSGITDSHIALSTVKEGAQDFLLKGTFDHTVIEKSIHYALERKRNIQQLSKSEQSYRLLFDTSPLPIFLVDRDLSILHPNRAFKSLYGYDFDEIQGLTLDVLLDSTESKERLKYSVQQQKSARFKHISKNGQIIHVEQLVAKIAVDNDDLYTIIINDETEKFIFEQEKMRLIAETLEDERARYSRELHDGLAQQLVALNLYLSKLSGISDSVDSVLHDCQEILSESMRQTRSICYNLTPPELEKGLIAGVKSMFQRISNVSSIDIKTNVIDQVEHVLEKYVDEYALYRIIQEFVNNAIKHSECTTIVFSISKKNDHQIIIEISDNGKGFDVSQVKTGLGLKNIDYRAKAAGLNYDFTSEIGLGTSLLLQLSYETNY
jgi:two-component system sensor histidine kinase UhpB